MRLEIKNKYQENLRWFYLVSYKDEEYKVRMWQFQKDSKSRPEWLDCIVTELPNRVEISQDKATLIRELYTTGQTYTFRIKSRLKKYYSVVDIDGNTFKLPYTDQDKKLSEGQSVMAVVKAVSGMNLTLELSHAKDNAELSFKTISELAADAHLTEQDAELIEKMMESDKHLAETKMLYDSGDAIWPFEAAISLDNIMLHQAADSQATQLLPILKSLTTYLLEESDLIRNMNETKREQWIDRLTEVAKHTEMYDETAEIIRSGNERDYIDRQLSNLKESENLYQPERKFRIIMTIFNRHDELMTEMTDRIFDIILEGNKQHWLAEPFRSAFVDMLEIFIATHRSQAGLSPNAPIAKKMIKAIAIQLLLANNQDNIDRRLNRTTFYRLLATQQNYNPIDMLDAAFDCLFADFDETMEFDWDDIASIENLYVKVSVKHHEGLSQRSFWRQVYRTNRNELIIDNEGVIIQPVMGRHQGLLPNNLLSWHNLDIQGSLGINTKFKSSKNLNTAAKVWSEIEENLAHKPLAGLYKKTTPDIGAVVVIKILRASGDELSFYCEIDDEHYAGHGWIDLKDIAPYMGRNEKNLSYFSDDEGNPLLFEAEVIDGPNQNDDLEFSMLNLINDYFQQQHYIGDTLLCNVRAIDMRDHQSYVCFSDDGASCIVHHDGSLRLIKDDVVEAQLVEFSQTGQLECEYVQRSSERFNIIDAFKNLLYNITDDTPQQQAQPEEEMTDSVVTELIGILDRMAVCAPTRIDTYGYLSMAKILADMKGDSKLSGYYANRRTLIRLFNDYETSGRMNEDKLHEIEEQMDKEPEQQDFYINEALTKFRIFAALRHKDSVDELMEISRTTTSHAIRDAADMAISLLLTDRFGIPTFKTQLEDRINKCLGVTVRTARGKDYGQETQTMELKSSIIYPADSNMQPQPKRQGEVIMRVICGFLNSDKGGTLYIGVNKSGGACGVHNDMKYMGNVDEDYYDRYVRNMINRTLGSIANHCCSDCSWETDEGYKVYVMKIKPSPELIRYNNVCWIRQGTETRPLKEVDMETFAQMHAQAYQEYIQSNAPTTEAEPEKAEKPKVAETKKPTSLYEIATSQWRRNAVKSYDEDYGKGTVAYLHFLKDNMYMQTSDVIYEDTHLSLAIHEKDADGYLFVAYESGQLLLVEMDELLNKNEGQRYQRCKSEKPIFACPMRRDDLVLTLWENKSGDIQARVDDISTMIGRHIDKDMNSDGALLCDTKFKRFVKCEIVKADDRSKLSKFCNRGKDLGQKITRNAHADIDLLKSILGVSPFEL